jgi:hypothetical protein
VESGRTCDDASIGNLAAGLALVEGEARARTHRGRRAPTMVEETIEVTEIEEKKKGGFFRKLMKIALVAAVVAGVVAFVKRRRGDDLDDVEWQELPPPAGG